MCLRIGLSPQRFRVCLLSKAAPFPYALTIPLRRTEINLIFRAAYPDPALMRKAVVFQNRKARIWGQASLSDRKKGLKKKRTA